MAIFLLMLRIRAKELTDHLTKLFLATDVPPPRAKRLAEIYVQASADGVYSHGVHMVPSLLRSIRAGEVPDLASDPKLIVAFSALERYEGNRGLGALNAEFCIDRAMALRMCMGSGARGCGIRGTGGGREIAGGGRRSGGFWRSCGRIRRLICRLGVGTCPVKI
jgi:hypothetical protein